MVEVFFPPPERSRLRLRVTGHCGAAAKGKDLVCAAVSSLVHTMVGGMEKEVQASVEGTFEEGICDVQVVVNESREPELAAIARVFRFGFEQLAREHPTHIRIVN